MQYGKQQIDIMEIRCCLIEQSIANDSAADDALAIKQEQVARLLSFVGLVRIATLAEYFCYVLSGRLFGE